MTEQKKAYARVLLNYEEGYKKDPKYVTVAYYPNEFISGCAVTAQDLIECADGEIVPDEEVAQP